MFRTKPNRCLNCSHLLDAATAVIGGRRPQPSDVTICISCGHIMAFDYDLSLRRLTDEEMVAVAGDRDIIMAQRAIAATRKQS